MPTNIGKYKADQVAAHTPGNWAHNKSLGFPMPGFFMWLAILFGCAFLLVRWPLAASFDLQTSEPTVSTILACFYAAVIAILFLAVYTIVLIFAARPPGQWRRVSMKRLREYVDLAELGKVSAEIRRIRVNGSPLADFEVELLMRNYGPPVYGIILVQTMKDFDTPCDEVVLVLETDIPEFRLHEPTAVFTPA